MLLHGETPGDIWDQHEAILNAVIAADPREAETIARHHISHASDTLVAGLANYPKVEAIAVASRRRRN